MREASCAPSMPHRSIAADHLSATAPGGFENGQTTTLLSMATTSFTKKPLGLEPAEPAVTPPPSTGNTTFVKKPKLGSAKSRKREIPEGLWTKCPKCSTMVFDKELDENLKVCPRCQHHFLIGCREPLHSWVGPS